MLITQLPDDTLRLLVESASYWWAVESVLALAATNRRFNRLATAFLMGYIAEYESISWLPMIMDEIKVACLIRKLVVRDLGIYQVLIHQDPEAEDTALATCTARYVFEENGANVYAPFLRTGTAARRALAALYVTCYTHVYNARHHALALEPERLGLRSTLVADFNDCLLGDAGLHTVLGWLALNEERLRFSIMDLSGTLITDDGMEELAKFLECSGNVSSSYHILMPSLHSISVRGNSLSDKGVGRLLTALVEGGYHLYDVDLRDTNTSLDIFDSGPWCEFEKLYGALPTVQVWRQELVDQQASMSDMSDSEEY